jgi:acetoin utilization deacetylase AcuC-like enzyme
MDVGVADATSDREYVERLGAALPRALDGAPELVCYLAGADPFRADRLGGLALTFDGLRVRDRMVLQAVRGAGAAAAIVLAGGYAVDVEDTVEVHVGTVIEALKIEPARPGVRPS